ncbi:hypothetical protein B566_EDAN014266 [Ephemera danica]|nr:hypothetical protein B566_EDAN014266 [Ephemera danica]
MTCCLKAICTSDATEAVETARLACGGHGYMTSSNLHPIFTMTSAAKTFEGENTVLLLQTARALIKTWLRVRQQKRREENKKMPVDESESIEDAIMKIQLDPPQPLVIEPPPQNGVAPVVNGNAETLPRTKQQS